MQFTFNLYSSLLLIFFVHVLVYAGMLWYRAVKQDRLSDSLLAWFLLLSALYIVPWMTGFAGWYDGANGPYRNILFYTPFLQGLFMGPVLYFYVKSLTNFHFRLHKADWIHFLPGVLYLLWCGVVVVTDRLILKKYYLMDGIADPDFDEWYQWLQRISISAYLLLSIRYYKKYKQYVISELSFIESAGLKWLRNFLIAFAILTILPLVQLLLQVIPFFRELDYVGSWYYYFAFVLVVYYIAINGFNAVVVPLRKLLFEPELLLQYQPPGLLQSPDVTEVAYELVNETGNDLQEWTQKIRNLLQQEKIYEDAELTLTQMAKRLSTNTSQLSKVINSGFRKNFNDFINEYRVQAVTDKLKAGEHHSQTLLSLAFDCGFNSKATFNRAFKKHTGLNPKEWLEKFT